MKYKSAFKYYLNSLNTLNKDFYFMDILSIPFKDEALIRTKYYNFYIKNLMDAWAIKEVISDNCYRYDNKRKQVVVDVGAGVGDFSIFSSNTSEKVYSVEIERERLRLLRKNLRINNAENAIVIDRKLKSLDYLFSKYQIKTIDFLKVDCEGCEYDLLFKTSDQYIENIKTVAMEVHIFDKTMRMNLRKLKKRLEASGMKISVAENPVHEYLHFLYAQRG